MAWLNAHTLRVWYRRLATSTPRQLLSKIGFWVAMAGLDAAYQRHLGTLTRVRRAVADVATTRKRLELQIGDLERQVGGRGDASRKAMHTGQVRFEQQAHLSRPPGQSSQPHPTAPRGDSNARPTDCLADRSGHVRRLRLAQLKPHAVVPQYP